MSVTTTADKKRNSAETHVCEALRDLSAIIIEQCCGHEDYSEEYVEKLTTAFNNLATIRNLF